jgi:hypothetical protein
MHTKRRLELSRARCTPHHHIVYSITTAKMLIGHAHIRPVDQLKSMLVWIRGLFIAPALRKPSCSAVVFSYIAESRNRASLNRLNILNTTATRAETATCIHERGRRLARCINKHERLPKRFLSKPSGSPSIISIFENTPAPTHHDHGVPHLRLRATVHPRGCSEGQRREGIAPCLRTHA